MRSTLVFFLMLVFGECYAEGIKAAVASNFINAFEKISERFYEETQTRVQASYASSGKLSTQIQHGAPFDVFLSADRVFARQIEKSDYGVMSTRKTYATGQLVLWSAKPELIDSSVAVLKSGEFRKLALANPKLAPYGVAANQVMHDLDLWTRFEDSLVYGENIGQAFNFVKTENAELGFVAKSQIIHEQGSYWYVPQSLYSPLDQQVVILKRAEGDKSVKKFYDFLFSTEVKQLIRQYGYAVP